MRGKNEKINISENNNLHFLNFYRPHKERGFKCPKVPFSCDLILSRVCPAMDRKYNGTSRHKSSLLIRSAREDFMVGVGGWARGAKRETSLTQTDIFG